MFLSSVQLSAIILHPKLGTSQLMNTYKYVPFTRNVSFKLLKHETGEPIGKLKCYAPRVPYEEAIYVATWMDKISGNCP